MNLKRYILSTFKVSKYFVWPFFIVMFFWSCSNTPEEKDIIPTINDYYIECNPEDFSKIKASYTENLYIPIRITFNGETRTARMRVRGDTSRKDPKKSLKIKFDSLLFNHIPKTLNLNAEFADKSYIRQYLSSIMMQQSGQICYHTEHVKVFLNGDFHGLFLQVENMDKNFLKRNNLDTKGNLYKATKDGACLSIFDNFEQKWEKKTNKKDDHSDLTKLIYDLNNIPDNQFQEFIKKTFEYNEIVNLLALNMFLSNSSTYYHNYYLYHDLYTTGKWKMFPWDMDKTMSYYNWMPYTYHRTSSEWESDNPLVERAILCKPMFEDIKNRIKELHKSHLNDKTLSPIIDSLDHILTEIIPLDKYDKLGSTKEWEGFIDSEKIYFNNHYKLLQQQFNEQPLSFKVYRFNQLQSDIITFKWQKSEHHANKKITYVLTYGSDFLLTDSSKTTYITNITDTFFTLNQKLKEGTYYWKVTAFDGTFYTDGFNTKNILTVKNGTKLPKIIYKNTTLTLAQSPYLIHKKMAVKRGITLTIDPGVEIHLKDMATIDCYGNIIANGTADSPITFMPDNTANSWGHIYFYEPSKKAYLKNVILKEGTINSKSKSLTLDSCSILINKKFMGKGYSNRSVLIYSGGGKVHINNSTFIGNGEGEGLVLFHGEAITENSYFENIPDAIEYIQMNKGVIRNNLVIKSPDDAIDLNACNNILIENNVLYNNFDKAISIGTEQYGASLKNIQIKNNLIVKNKNGIAVKDSSVAYISNNTMIGNTRGVYVYKKREGYKKGGTAYVKNSILQKNEYSIQIKDDISSISVSHTITHNEVLAGTLNFKGDPKFIDPANNNFHLRPNSPCIKKGDDGNDIGAFPMSATTVSLSKIHISPNKKNSEGVWVEINNNYNISVDLSLYKIVVFTNEQKKEFIFPIGTSLKPLGKLYLANRYYSFIDHINNNVTVIGGFPKINAEAMEIRLLNAHGDIIDTFKFSRNSIKSKNATFVSNGINNEAKKTWKMIPD